MILSVRVTPNAARNQIDGPQLRGNGQVVLRVRVSAVPDKGKANKAVIALLAKKLRLPKSTFEITAGHHARLKTLAINGVPDQMIETLDALLEQST